MFGKLEGQLKKRCVKLEVSIVELRNEKDTVEDNLYTLKSEFESLSRQHKIREEEIAHKIRMRDEQVGIEKEKGIAEAERKADERIMEVKGEYQDKLTKQLEKRNDELREMYTEILGRLPEVAINVGGTTVKTPKKKR